MSSDEFSKPVRRIALYGKGGIGKSTTAANISAALADLGYRVLQIGCDPKADSTKMLLHDMPIRTILDCVKEGNTELLSMIHEGYKGIMCAECGGPRPGTGCAGRGIIVAFETLEAKDVIRVCQPDVIIYDVLGDVVCGGFAMPIRHGYTRDVFIVTSGELMALYAANNIAIAVNDMSSKGYARLGGIIQNSRDIECENDVVDAATEEIGTDVIFRMPRDKIVQTCESKKMTVVEGAPDSVQADLYRELAKKILSLTKGYAGGMKGE